MELQEAVKENEQLAIKLIERMKRLLDSDLGIILVTNKSEYDIIDLGNADSIALHANLLKEIQNELKQLYIKQNIFKNGKH